MPACRESVCISTFKSNYYMQFSTLDKGKVNEGIRPRLSESACAEHEVYIHRRSLSGAFVRESSPNAQLYIYSFAFSRGGRTFIYNIYACDILLVSYPCLFHNNEKNIDSTTRVCKPRARRRRYSSLYIYCVVKYLCLIVGFSLSRTAERDIRARVTYSLVYRKP